jgi:chromosome segregation ATPase
LGENYIVNELKRQVKEAESGREEALSKETEMTLLVQGLRQEVGLMEGKTKRAIAVRDNEVREVQNEANELISALEYERETFEKEVQSLTTTVSDSKQKLESVSKQLEDALSTKDTMQQARLSLEKQLHRVKSDSSKEETAKHALETKIDGLETTIFDMKKTVAQQDRQLKDLSAAK